MLLGLTPELRAAEPEPDLEDDPRALIEARHKEIQEVIASTPDEAEMQDKIRAIMDRFVDYELFAMLAGRSFWDALTPAQQEEFVTLFKGLIQRTYLRRFKANRPFSVALHGETRFNSDRDRALVSSIIESDKVAADVVYKLHPGEVSRWREEYPQLASTGEINVVGEDGPALYHLLSESRAQVGVYTTVLYEGLCFDLDTYLVDLPGIEYMDELLERGGATLVTTVDELGNCLASGTQKDYFETSRIFRPNTLSNIRQALDSIDT